MWTSSVGATYPSKTIQSIFACKMAENCAIRFPFRVNLNGDPLQMRRGSTGTNRRTLSVATGDYVAGRSAGYENQAWCLVVMREIMRNSRVSHGSEIFGVRYRCLCLQRIELRWNGLFCSWKSRIGILKEKNVFRRRQFQSFDGGSMRIKSAKTFFLFMLQ